jgi:hypothetical protein
MGNVRAGWDAALEWAAQMIEAGYPPDAPPPNALDLAMTLRAKKGDVDMLQVGMAVATKAFGDWRRLCACGHGEAAHLPGGSCIRASNGTPCPCKSYVAAPHGGTKTNG